jgi:hypothetical protein
MPVLQRVVQIAWEHEFRPGDVELAGPGPPPQIDAANP